MEIDPELVVPDPALSIADGALAPWAGSTSNYYEQVTEAIAERYGVDAGRAVAGLPEEQRALFLDGTNGEPLQVSTATATDASAPTRRALRGSSPTSSAATARRTPSGRARRSRSTCRSCRAPSAAEHGCALSRGR